MTTESATPRWADLLEPDHLVPLVVLATGVLLHSMNALLMSTVMPSAVKDIGGLEYMAWPTTGFLAASVVAASGGSVVKAALGARNAYILAALLFAGGSLIAGAAPNIFVLVSGRVVQGFGGGLLSSVAYVIVRNVFPQALWAHVFALFSSVWGISALAGPLIGGVFAGMGYWPGAFYVIAAIALLVAAFATLTLPSDPAAETLPRFPGLRLAMVAAAIISLSLAGPAESIGTQLAYIALGLVLFVVALNVDRRAASPLAPSDAFSLHTACGLALWVLFLLSVANDPFPIYGPLFLQVLRDMDPLDAGYLVAMEAMSWTIVAAIVAGSPERIARLFVAFGPLAMGVGLVIISMTIESASIPWLLMGIFFAGGGIGASFAFISRIILASANERDADAAATSIPTVQLVGLATGAAIAGLLANVTGFSSGLSVETASSASTWVPGAFVLAALAASLLASSLVFSNRLKGNW
ncbi:MAG: MFS transporter [Pseudomonadales bacterium]|nr:MFS transporter [Pseudomonadales bacterium]